jgi:hypothetical protein
VARFSQDYPEDTENPARYFEIYSPPIRTQYSQVCAPEGRNGVEWCVLGVVSTGHTLNRITLRQLSA